MVFMAIYRQLIITNLPKIQLASDMEFWYRPYQEAIFQTAVEVLWPLAYTKVKKRNRKEPPRNGRYIRIKDLYKEDINDEL